VLNPAFAGLSASDFEVVQRAYAGPSFYALTPCRVIDTRGAAGPNGAPALAAGAARTFTLAGRCGVPANARTAAANITVTQPTVGGLLTLFPSGTSAPATSTIDYRAGQTRANNSILLLGASGDFQVLCSQSSGTVHLIVDVNGYFQ